MAEYGLGKKMKLRGILEEIVSTGQQWKHRRGGNRVCNRAISLSMSVNYYGTA